MRSKLARDRWAVKVGRYAKKNAKLTGYFHTGVSHQGKTFYRALKWMYDRRVRAQWDGVRADQQERVVWYMFYNH